MDGKIDIRALDRAALRQYFEEIGEKRFRADQVYEWLWNKACRDFDEMTNLSKNLRERLKAEYVINHIHVDEMQRSQDGTIKNAVRLHDGLVVESVLIPTDKRITACVSSQVGCSLDCEFCATARLKRMRNLNADEIFDQVAAIREQSEQFFDRPLTNIVMMGMGEPLLNYKNVLLALEKVTSENGLGMSARRITLSTVGIPKMIRQLADDEVKFNLAVSLHSARNEVRDKIMPFNRKNPLEELTSALEYWYRQTRKKVTFEYVVWKGVNDQQDDIDALVRMCKRIPSKVNLIQYNSIDDPRFEQASDERLQAYQEALSASGVIARIRHSRGQDIDAACGQLANKNETAGAVTE
jgi:23S rRNA (adenine2503-C2)-methyltransferase